MHIHPSFLYVGVSVAAHTSQYLSVCLYKAVLDAYYLVHNTTCCCCLFLGWNIHPCMLVHHATFQRPLRKNGDTETNDYTYLVRGVYTRCCTIPRMIPRLEEKIQRSWTTTRVKKTITTRTVRTFLYGIWPLTFPTPTAAKMILYLISQEFVPKYICEWCSSYGVKGFPPDYYLHTRT